MIIRDPSNNSKSPIYQELAKFAPKKKDFETQQPRQENVRFSQVKNFELTN